MLQNINYGSSVLLVVMYTVVSCYYNRTFKFYGPDYDNSSHSTAFINKCMW